MSGFYLKKKTDPTTNNPIRDNQLNVDESPLPTTALVSPLPVNTIPAFQVYTQNKQALKQYQKIKYSMDSK